MTKEQAAALTEQNLRVIFAFAMSRVSHRQDAEDLAGEIVVQILESAHRLKNDDAFFGFVRAIEANTYKKYLTRRGISVIAELEEESVRTDEDPADALIAREEIAVLRRELSILSREHRECTVAYYMEGLSCAEIARRRGISAEMVKYYLFKTRKILKEGMTMEREFGEKSYNPARFEFITIFDGIYNAEYRNLFNRRLPGNILLSAYYTPMTVRELSLELGVASPYMEDEIDLLKKYNLLTELSGGRVQTKLVIFTRAYNEDFIRCGEPVCAGALKNILPAVRKKLPRLREMGFPGDSLPEEILLWDLLFFLLWKGNGLFADACPATQQRQTLYRGATGINYGTDFDQYDSEYSCNSFAGIADLREDYTSTFAEFNILPENCRISAFPSLWEDVSAMIRGECPASVPIFSDAQWEQLSALFAEEIRACADLLMHLYETALEQMRQHAPADLEEMEQIVAGALFFRSVGLIGAAAVRSGALALPPEGQPAGVLIHKKPQK